VSDEHDRQAVIDAEHLKLLEFGYYISAVTTAFWSLFGLAYAVMGFSLGAITKHAPSSPEALPPDAIVWVFVVFGGVVFVAMLSVAAVKVHVGRCLSRRRSRTFCLIVASLTCVGVPYGTILGICTFVVLTRPAVAQMFAAGHLSDADR
jgi:hypothetical protein